MAAEQKRNGGISVGNCRIDDNDSYKVDHFVIPPRYQSSLSKILIPHGMIVDRVEKMASDIFHHFEEEDEVHLVCVLKGSRCFFTELQKFLTKQQEYASQSKPTFFAHYIQIEPSETGNNEDVKIVFSADLAALKGKCAVVVEDVIDTGFTMTQLSKQLQEISPKSIKVATLLEKRNEKNSGLKVDFLGFSIPDEHIVGFGTDYNEMFRDLNHICVINDKGLEEFRVKAATC